MPFKIFYHTNVLCVTCIMCIKIFYHTNVLCVTCIMCIICVTFRRCMKFLKTDFNLHWLIWIDQCMILKFMILKCISPHSVKLPCKNTYHNACMPSMEAVCTIWMIVFGMTGRGANPRLTVLEVTTTLTTTQWLCHIRMYIYIICVCVLL